MTLKWLKIFKKEKIYAVIAITVVPENLSKYLMNLLSFNRSPITKSIGNKRHFPKFLTAAELYWSFFPLIVTTLSLNNDLPRV